MSYHRRRNHQRIICKDPVKWNKNMGATLKINLRLIQRSLS